MTKLLIILFVFFFGCNAKKVHIKKNNDVSFSQNCECINYMKTKSIVTKVSIYDVDSEIQLVFHCVSLLREYIVGEDGDYEIDTVDCISSATFKSFLSKDVKFFVHNEQGEFLNNQEAKNKFFELIKSEEQHFFELQFDANRVITQVFETTF